MNELLASTEEIMVLMLRDVVVYPHMVIPLFVGRKKSVKALELAVIGDKKIFLVAQKNSAEDEPAPENIYQNRYPIEYLANAAITRRYRQSVS